MLLRAIAARLALPFLLVSGLAVPSLAGVADHEPQLKVELNLQEPGERGCRLTFVVQNALGGDLSRIAYEMVLFDRHGKVLRIAAIDFREMPQGRTRVLRFDFAGVKCDELGRVLVNDATQCAGSGMDSSACMRHLVPSSRTETEFGT